MSKLTVCMIAQEPSKTVRLHQVARSLRRLGYNVLVLVPSFNLRFRPRYLSAGLRYLGIMLQVLFAKADIYYVFNNPDIGFPVLFKRGRFVYDVRNPWGAEVYDLTGNGLAAEICERIEHTMTRNADVVVAVNSRLAERAKSWGAKRVFLVPNYPSQSFKPTLGRQEMRDKHGLHGKKVVLFTGNFASVECAFDMVKIFPKVTEKVNNAVLILIGDGPQKNLIERYITRSKSEQNVRLFGRIPRVEVPNWLAAADVVVVPRRANMRSSQYYCPESIWKVTEALRMGKPVVAGAVGGFITTTLPIKTVSLERFDEGITDVLQSSLETKPLKEISWDRSEKQLRKALEYIL